MGMAAGQARFLALTARKSNVEFQGQQINQQRTTLSNESSAYNEQLLSMKVPTAPSSDTYTKTTYSFTNPALSKTCTVSNITNVSGSSNKVNLSFTYSTTGSAADSGSAYFYAVTTPADATKGTPATTNYFLNDGGASGTALTPVTVDKDHKASAEDATNLALIYNTTSTSYDQSGQTYYKYKNTDGNYCYVTLADLQNCAQDSSNANSSSKPMLYHYVNTKASIDETDDTSFKGVTANWDSSGRLSSVVKDNTTYTMSTKTVTDSDAYADAMSEYNYQKALYDQGLNDINAKLSVVQQEDKTLELKLKDVDTEQQAISTEMDAVKKVVDKNVESTFKTFG